MILRGGRRAEIKMVIILRTTNAIKVHQLRKTARIQSPAPIMNRPMYHQMLRLYCMYSTPCQVISLSFLAITKL